jgi:hypothetical protein
MGIAPKSLFALLVALGVVVVTPALASADTDVDVYDDGGATQFEIYDDGGGGTITVTTPTAGTIHVTGTDLLAYDDCSGTATALDCTYSGPIYSDIELGGGADTFDASGVTHDLGLAVYGGDDTDTLIGSQFGDYLEGGDDSDTLTGGDGDDYIGLSYDATDADSASSSCGIGADVVSYDSSDPVISCEEISPGFTGTPTLNQAPAIGATLSATDVAASGGPDLSYAYAWFGCNDACNSTASTFTVPPAAWNNYFEADLFVGVPGGPTGTFYGDGVYLYSDYLGTYPTYDDPTPRVNSNESLWEFTVGKLKKKNRLPVTVKTAGLITVGPDPEPDWRARRDNKYLATAAVTASRAGTYILPVKLNRAGLKRLKKHKKMALDVWVSFGAQFGGGTAGNEHVTLKLTKKKKKK